MSLHKVLQELGQIKYTIIITEEKGEQHVQNT